MRIGIATRHFPPYIRGGSHLSVYYLAKGLVEKGMEVHVFTSPPPNTQDGSHMDIDLNMEDYRTFDSRIPRNSLERDEISVKMAIQLRRKLKELNIQFDVLHSYGMDTIPAIWFNKKHCKIVVASANENWATCPFSDHTFDGKICARCNLRKLSNCAFAKVSGSFIRKTFAFPYHYTSMKLKKYIVKRLDLLLPISESVRDLLIQNGFDPNKMRVCYNMLDPRDYENLNNRFLHDLFGLHRSIRVILYAGRLAPYKGVEYLVRAIPDVVKVVEDVKFVFLGHGGMNEKLMSLSRELKVEDKVIFGRFLDPKNMPHAYASSYCVILPSTYPDPFPRVPIEALASGTAVVATDVGGIPEIIIDKETGLLIKPFSSSAISEAILTLLVDGKMRDNLIEIGTEMVLEKHSLHKQVNNYISAYEEIL